MSRKFKHHKKSENVNFEETNNAVSILVSKVKRFAVILYDFTLGNRKFSQLAIQTKCLCKAGAYIILKICSNMVSGGNKNNAPSTVQVAIIIVQIFTLYTQRMDGFCFHMKVLKGVDRMGQWVQLHPSIWRNDCTHRLSQKSSRSHR